jgi:hypothetical protein
MNEEEKRRTFTEKAQQQRQKIYSMKQNQDELFEEEIEAQMQEDHRPQQPAKLTSDNLSRMDVKSQKSQRSKKSVGTKGSKASSKKSKPAWAMTEGQLEEEKEAEIDDLLEFAYELDYDKFMEDFEIRQVFSIIKDRVHEIKKDQDWKEKVADEWNNNANSAGTKDPSEHVEDLVNQSKEQHSVFDYSK